MKIKVILSSVRENRVGERVAKWVVKQAQQQPGFEVELLDLSQFALPRFDEPISPRYNPRRDPHPRAGAWLQKLAEADGYVIVTPEYNHSIPASLKDALDYTDFQMQKKPAAIVSYGTVGGARAAEHLKGILIEAKAAVVPEAVAIIGAQGVIDEDGNFTGDPTARGNAKDVLEQVLTELSWWTSTLKAGRQQLAQHTA